MNKESRLDLNDIVQHPGRTLEMKVETELLDQNDINLVKPIKGDLKAYSTGNALIISGKFNVNCILDCSRCSHPLESGFEFNLEEEFDIEGVPSGYGTGGMARIVPPIEEEEPLFEENSLLIEALLRQLVLAGTPMQTLCSYGWEGDCPHAFKAKEDADAIKNRFAVLKSILEKEDR